MKTFDRNELKNNAKKGLKINYWKSVLVGVVSTVVAGGTVAGISYCMKPQFINTFNFTVNGQTTSITSGNVSDFMHALTTNQALPVLLATLAALFTFVLFVAIITHVIRAFLIAPLEVGCDKFFKKNINEEAELGELGCAYKNNYLTTVGTLLLRDIKIALWSLLLVVPGIVKAYEYRMVPYILAENPNMSSSEVFKLSKEMMTGNKWNTFVMDLSFLLWNILGAFTFGLLNVFYVNPYQKMTEAGIYDAVKA